MVKNAFELCTATVFAVNGADEPYLQPQSWLWMASHAAASTPSARDRIALFEGVTRCPAGSGSS